MAEDQAPDSGGRINTLVVSTESQPQPTNVRAVLTTAGSAETGQIFILDKPGEVVSIGRAESCTIRFDDARVSSEHARITQVMGVHMIADCKSTNGTFVNDARVSGPTQLRNGDRIRLGTDVVLRFSLMDDVEQESLQRVYHAAIYDGLTGVYNRKHLDDRLDGEVQYAARHKTALSIALFDLDHFKGINDTYGHQVGDRVLAHAARVSLAALRREDMLGRFGGEEFMVILRGIRLEGAVIVAERLRFALESQPVVSEAATVRATASFGVASMDCLGRDVSTANLVATADRRLYSAKSHGRNRVIAGG